MRKGKINGQTENALPSRSCPAKNSGNATDQPSDGSHRRQDHAFDQPGPRHRYPAQEGRARLGAHPYRRRGSASLRGRGATALTKDEWQKKYRVTRQEEPPALEPVPMLPLITSVKQ